eukprot:74349-Pelagomonas_calceolata.AAC.1
MFGSNTNNQLLCSVTTVSRDALNRQLAIADGRILLCARHTCFQNDKEVYEGEHLQHAAKKLKPQQSPRLHAAFIDFSQAYDTVPRLQLWDHLQCIAMHAPLLWAIKESYQDDEYILIDGDRRACVRPTNGVKQ